MKKIYFMLLLIPLMWSCSKRVYTDTARGADFKSYRTFAWEKPSEEEMKKHPIVRQNLAYFVNMEMEQRGFVLDTENPDLLLNFDLKVEKRQYMATSPMYGYDMGFYRPWGMMPYRYGMGPRMFMGGPYMMGFNSYPVQYRKSTITVLVKDRQKNRVVWSGSAVETVDKNTFKSKNLASSSKKIFKKFPVRSR